MPSRTSMLWSEPRSIWEYERTADTSSETRRVDSRTSPSTAVEERVATTQSIAGCRPGPTASSTRSHQSVWVPAAARTGASSQAWSTPCPSSQSVSASSRSALASESRETGRSASSRRSASRAANWVAEMPCSASPRKAVSSEALVSSSAATARTAAAAGLLSSCANPAARRPRVTSESRWRAVASIRRAVPKMPLIRCTPRGSHAAESLAQRLGRHPQEPPGYVAVAGREIDAAGRPTPGSRRTTCRGPSIRPTTTSSPPSRRVSSSAPSTSTHQ